MNITELEGEREVYCSDVISPTGPKWSLFCFLLKVQVTKLEPLNDRLRRSLNPIMSHIFVKLFKYLKILIKEEFIIINLTCKLRGSTGRRLKKRTLSCRTQLMI